MTPTHGMAFFSLSAVVIKTPPVPLKDPILVAVFGGVVRGAGAGIVLRSLGSAGGADILAILRSDLYHYHVYRTLQAKNVIFSIDLKAFVVVISTIEVIGKQHGTRKIYQVFKLRTLNFDKAINFQGR